MKLKSNITIKDAQSTLDITGNILNETGPRLTGTESCERAGKLLESHLDKFCDQTYSENFQCSRDAFLYHVRYFSISYVLAFIFLCLGGLWYYGAAAVTIFGCLMILLEIGIEANVGAGLAVFFELALALRLCSCPLF